MTKKAIEYIWKVTMKGNLDKDSYSLNVAAYALALAKSNKLYEVLKKRDSLMVFEGTFKYDKASYACNQILALPIFFLRR